MKKLSLTFIGATLALSTQSAFAGAVAQVDEPHMLPLLLFGIVALWVSSRIRGRKK